MDGFYSESGAGYCIRCPAGQSCFNGTHHTLPIDCELGYYSGAGVSTCSPCTAGKFCYMLLSYSSICIVTCLMI